MGSDRLFDLNIEKILEAWDNTHAARELIANALDEQVLSETPDIEVVKESPDTWVIRDFGRGLHYEHFTQNENPEKLANVGRVIGKFGVGLKDAMATLHRNGVVVEIESAHGVITLTKREKHGFSDVVTLHAAVAPPRDSTLTGTIVRLVGLPDAEMEVAKRFFLKFSGETVIEQTGVGRILERAGATSRIYVAGLLVAEEVNFAFSYDITSLTAPMRKALNRERTNVGRTAYTERVKSMLLQTRSEKVAKVIASELVKLEQGTGSDEVGWKDVAVHACKILNSSGDYLFVTAAQLSTNASIIDHARHDGVHVVTIPNTIHAEVAGASDIDGAPIRDLSMYQAEWNQSFTFDWVPVERMTEHERGVFGYTDAIVKFMGGLPSKVQAIRVSQTMRPDFMSDDSPVGLWDPGSSSIVIRRDQLALLSDFAGVLLHELAHARTGYADVSRDFETELTRLLGVTASAGLRQKQHALPTPPSFWKRLVT